METGKFIMYLFDKNGNEVKIGDLVYFDEGKDSDRIGKIQWVSSETRDTISILDIDTNLTYGRSLCGIRKVPDTIVTLMILENLA